MHAPPVVARLRDLYANGSGKPLSRPPLICPDKCLRIYIILKICEPDAVTRQDHAPLMALFAAPFVFQSLTVTKLTNGKTAI